MATIINTGKELIRINSEKQRLEYSKNDGKTWLSRYTGSSYGDFQTIQENGTELLATTSKGLYYSKNEGRTWLKK